MSNKMTEQIIKDWQVPSREERETILTYEEEVGQWHIYSDVPKHARKYEKFIDESKRYRKGYSVNSGQLVMVEGYIIDGNVGISKKRKLTEKQRQKLAENLKRNKR